VDIMNKKIGVIVLFLALIVFSGLVLGEVDTYGAPTSGDLPLYKEVQDLQDKNQDELIDQWSEFLSNSTSFKKIDAVLQKGDIVFFVVLGEHYSFSLRLFFILLLWLAFFMMAMNSFELFSTFNRNTSIVAGFVLSVILGHMGAYKIVYFLIVKTFDLAVGIWQILIITVWLAGIMIFIFFSKTFLKMIERYKEKAKTKRDVDELRKEQYERYKRQSKVNQDLYGWEG